MDKCSICKMDYEGFGNNAYPLTEGRCCDDCNYLVIAERMSKILPKIDKVQIVKDLKAIDKIAKEKFKNGLEK